MTRDSEFLNFIIDRLVNVHGENENVDFVLHLRKLSQEAMIREGTFRVNLNYFRPDRGKYYSEGHYQSEFSETWKIWEEVQEMLDSGNLPGLVKGHSPESFIVHVSIPGHPHNVPQIIIPKPTRVAPRTPNIEAPPKREDIDADSSGIDRSRRAFLPHNQENWFPEPTVE